MLKTVRSLVLCGTLAALVAPAVAMADAPHPAPAVRAPVPAQPIPGSRQARFSLVGDIARAGKTRLYVYDIKLQIFVDRFLISPGRKEFPTAGNSFVIQTTQFLPTWTPPNSAWAKGLTPKGPGIGNPMGLLKMSLGANSEFIHGIPPSEEPALGTAASHGCLRISSANNLYLYQRYAGIGTKVSLNRDVAASTLWDQQYTARGGHDHLITDGRELIPALLVPGHPTFPTVMEYHD